MSDDPQSTAESLDEDWVDDVDDRAGDEFGEALPQYPPDRPFGVNTVGITPVEEDAGESFSERTHREEPEAGRRHEASDERGNEVGQIVDDSATTEDREAELIAEAEPGTELAPEEQAMHEEPER